MAIMLTAWVPLQCSEAAIRSDSQQSTSPLSQHAQAPPLNNSRATVVTARVRAVGRMINNNTVTSESVKDELDCRCQWRSRRHPVG